MRARLKAIQDRIERACETVGRDPALVTLIAVSKTHPADSIRALYDLGHRVFGESRLQEAIPKIEALPGDIEWHFIGKLQSNKAKKATEYFRAIHTIESESQLKELAKGRPIDGLVEVNIGEEPQKSGIAPEMLDDFLKIVLQYDQVKFRGLMAIGPAHPNAEAMRPYFQRMFRLNERVQGEWLSIGMSQDFDVAIQEGATHVRVGTALFGERPSL
ncbi:MAG: YggS family pyridoxal phosphate-dependent enzyme [Fimbriimonadales bacterium]